MQKKSLQFVTAALIFVNSFAFASTYWAGSGTEENPYQIWTAQQMNAIGANPHDWCRHFELRADIDMHCYDCGRYNIIGSSPAKAFTGSFNGNGYKISNLNYSSTSPSEFVGLFGCTNGAFIEDVCLQNVRFEGSAYKTGGLVGQNGGFILDCCVAGSVTGTDGDVGGLVGINYGTITHSQSDCSVIGQVNVGGFAGRNFGTILSCTCDGSVLGFQRVGGLTGSNYGTIQQSSSLSSVTGKGSDLGGLVGYNYGADIYEGFIRSCFATGSVVCTAVYVEQNAGGLVGENFEGHISVCYATGSVSGYKYVGGFVGNNYCGSISTCYSAGHVDGLVGLGGFAGSSFLGIAFCHWDTQSSSQLRDIGFGVEPYTEGLMGNQTAEMQTLATFTGGEWTFIEREGQRANWMMLREGEDYPRLAWQHVYDGDIAGLYGVGFEDIGKLLANWLQDCTSGCDQSDIDGSGIVDLGDFEVIAAQWMRQGE